MIGCVYIPAHNEADYIGACLEAVIGSDLQDAGLQIVVIANACTDETVQIAKSFTEQAQTNGWILHVIDTPIPGKLSALNRGEKHTQTDVRIYLDADVIVSPSLVSELIGCLTSQTPRYASGSPDVIAPKGWLLRQYARFWQKLPFVSTGVPGFGIFAVNAAGRARWDMFPDIISDDTFVRLHFSEAERVRVAATYQWPMINGFSNLIRVRRRQDIGVAEIAKRYPELLSNDGGTRPGFGQLTSQLVRDPIGFAAYGIVSLAVRMPIAKSKDRWTRGR